MIRLMLNKTLTLTIVIPVFNEEDYLADCLSSIADQSEMPDEVIVVDNNSTDASVQIANSFPFVTLIHEKRQHQAFAQKTGFNKASSDILGRIDADSILPKEWVKDVKRIMAAEKNLKAITGLPEPYDICMAGPAVSIFMFYHNLASRIAGTQMLWGANSAIRRDAWLAVQDRVLQRADIWEDYDLALLIGGRQSIKLAKDLKVRSSFRCAHKPFLKQVEWQYRVIRTFYHHSSLLRAMILAICWNTMIIFYPLVLLDENVFKPLMAFKERRQEVVEPTVVGD